MSVDHLLVCNCGEVLVKATDGEIKLRSKILVFKDGRAVAVCKGCGAELVVPVSLDRDELLLKSKNPRLFIAK